MKHSLTHREVLMQAWPLIVANATTPLLGLADAAALGHFGAPTDLAGIALGALIFNFLYWGFGFLRMTTTGLVAQARGAGAIDDAQAALGRALLLGAGIGSLILLASPWLAPVALSLLSGGASEEARAAGYFGARIWGAPAALSTLGATGLLIGLGRFRQILVVQLVTNGLNIALDGVFVAGLGWGAEGVGWGTAISEWAGACVCISLALRAFAQEFARPLRSLSLLQSAMKKSGLRATFVANFDIMVRTLALLFGFGYFTNQGALFGAKVLAANHLLLQFVSLSAFFLDGFAHVAEALLGSAKGSRDRPAFDLALRRTSEVAGFFAIVLALTLLLFGSYFLDALTKFPHVIELAQEQLPFTALYVACSVVAFQLDGVFIGCGQTGAMRNTALISLAAFLTCAHFSVPHFANTGLWLSFVLYVCARGASLLLMLPHLRRSI